MLIGSSVALQSIAYVVASVLSAYGAGRVHQWYMHSMDRDRAFREGYNHGFHALFPFAARESRPTAQPSGGDQRIAGSPQVPHRDPRFAQSGRAGGYPRVRSPRYRRRSKPGSRMC